MTTPITLPDDHFGLYIHIPFCVRKCRYCDFASQPVGAYPSLPDAYLDALAREAAHWRAQYSQPIHSIFIGGGTPTAMHERQLRRLWHEVIAPFTLAQHPEISIEANPGTLTDDVLAAIAELPVNRVSLGAQSFDARELALLGRIHTADEVHAAVAALRAIGISRINLDLMYALPGQTAAQWESSLQQALALRPDHLSLYSLILEEGTAITDQVAAGELPHPDEEEEEEMVRRSAIMLADAGYTLYEVSNAARAGAQCRHNLGYWLGRDYLGLGASAASAIGGLRWRNTDDAAGYAARVNVYGTAIDYVERLSARERLLERVMLGLRLRGGFDLHAAETVCGCRLRKIAPQAYATLADDGLIVQEGPVLRLSAEGFSLANLVVSRLMAENT